MTARTIKTWLGGIGAMLAMGVLFVGDARGEESYPTVASRLWPWPAPIHVGCSRCCCGNCGAWGTRGVACSRCRSGWSFAPMWFPNPGPAGPIHSGVQRNFETARPTYQVTPPPARQPQSAVPSSNRGNPFYEYREVPPQTAAPAPRSQSAVKSNESPFYP